MKQAIKCSQKTETCLQVKSFYSCSYLRILKIGLRPVLVYAVFSFFRYVCIYIYFQLGWGTVKFVQ